MTSPPQTMRAAAAAVQLLLPLLSFVYSIAVHIFLSSFNERSLLKFHHWHPILIRAVFFCVCVICWRFTSSRGPDGNTSNDNGGDQNEAGILFIPLAFVTAMLSTKFILQTRQIEINGPPPPQPMSTRNKSTPLKQDRVILITGANSGIGLETTRILYHQYNATVILACRSKARAMEAMQSIDPSWNEFRQNSNNNNSSGSGAIRFGSRMHFLPLDLTSIQSIRTAVKIFLEEMKMPLHVLINNAGVMLNERMETVDGLEMTMAANVSIACILLMETNWMRCAWSARVVCLFILADECNRGCAVLTISLCSLSISLSSCTLPMYASCSTLDISFSQTYCYPKCEKLH